MADRPKQNQPSFTDCGNCGSADHGGYSCPCACHSKKQHTAEDRESAVRERRKICFDACAGMDDPAAEIARLRGRLAAAQRFFREHAQDERAEAYPDESSDIAIVCGLGGENSELREIEKLKAENAALREVVQSCGASAHEVGAACRAVLAKVQP